MAAPETHPSPTASDALTERLRTASPALSPAARRVLRFIADNRALALALSAAELAARTGVSDATVVRTVQALGFGGLPELRRLLAASLGVAEPGPAEAMR